MFPTQDKIHNVAFRKLGNEGDFEFSFFVNDPLGVISPECFWEMAADAMLTLGEVVDDDTVVVSEAAISDVAECSEKGESDLNDLADELQRRLLLSDEKDKEA